jgi:nucleoside permease NupC
MKELIIRESGEKVYNFISQYITSGKNKTLVVSNALMTYVALINFLNRLMPNCH